MDGSKGILTINSGSSGVKYALFDLADPPRRRFEASASHSSNSLGPSSMIAALLEDIERQCGSIELVAVGHRVVHGGPHYCDPQRVTVEMISRLRQVAALDPEHSRDEIGFIEAFQSRFPDLPQVACFDTAFHHDLPRVAQLLAIPYQYQAQGLRRYGFHGLSYEFLMAELGRLDGRAPRRVILAHLGHGASLAAVADGKAMDTSMGFTPAGGLPMGTRSGDVDPSLPLQLASLAGLDAKAFDHMVHFQSGLLGVSGTSSDMQALLVAEAQDPRAADAVALFCYHLKKNIGAFAAALGGLDALVFSGGIGERAPSIRARGVQGLEFLGVELDPSRNAGNEAVISAPDSRVIVRVIVTDEQRMIAQAVARQLAFNPAEEG